MSDTYKIVSLILIFNLNLWIGCTDEGSEDTMSGGTTAGATAGIEAGIEAGLEAGVMAGEMMGGMEENGGVNMNNESQYLTIKINEIVTKGDPSDWVEVYNTGDTDVDITGCFWSDDLTALDQPQGVIPEGPGAVIPARGFALFLLNSDTFGFKLSSDEELALTSPNGVMIDSVDYNQGDAPNGGSYGRLPDGSGDFQTLFVQTPAGPNDAGVAPVCGDTICELSEDCPEDCQICGDGLCEEGEECVEDCSLCGDGLCDEGEMCDIDCVDSVCGDDLCSVGEECEEDCSSDIELVINELVAAGDPDWVELYNMGSEDLELDDLFISDDLNQPQRFALRGVSIEAESFLVIDLSDETVGFKLGGDEVLYLSTESGRLVDFVDWEEGDAPELMSYGRSPDGTGDFQTLMTPTPEASNSEQ